MKNKKIIIQLKRLIKKKQELNYVVHIKLQVNNNIHVLKYK